MRQSLREAFPSLSGNSGKRKSDFKSKQGTRSKAPALTKKKTCNVVYKDLILLPEPDTKTVPTHRSRITLENDGFVVHEFPIDRRPATVWNWSGKILSPGALLAVLYFSS